LRKASKEDGVWESYFSSKDRLTTLLESSKYLKNKKDLYMMEVNTKNNLFLRKRFQIYNLVGHEK